MTTNPCEVCGTAIPVTLYAAARRDTATSLRCRRCGAVHGFRNGEQWLISPRVYPIDQGIKPSPWMLTHTRPLVVGAYECRFRNLEPDNKLTLWWDGRAFCVSSTDKRPVNMYEFLTWRGSWKE